MPDEIIYGPGHSLFLVCTLSFHFASAVSFSDLSTV